jgi:drug/metabolite transporter (DMT)-like permease
MKEQRKEAPGFLSKGLTNCEIPGRSGFLHPYLQLSISIVLTAAAQVFLKLGVDSQSYLPWYAFSNLFSSWVLAGVLAMLMSLLSWLYALKSVPLVVAFNLAATNHIMVAIGSWIFLGEEISIHRWVGIGLIALGAGFIARPLARVQEKI